MEKILAAESRSFDVLESEIRGNFERLGGRVKRMDEAELFGQMYSFFNPSRIQSGDLGKLYDPTQSLMANLLTSEGNATDSGFFLDGRFVGLLVIKSLPDATCSGIIQCITSSLPIREFGITMNVIPLDATLEIEKEEKEVTRIQRSLRGGGQHRVMTTLDQRMKRIQKLAGNEEVPFEVQIIIRAWDETQQGLQTKLGLIKAAISRMGLAKHYSPVFPVSAKAYFLASVPGWIWDSCRDFFHPIGDAPLANLLPISGSPVLGDAEALYDGANGGVIGINTFLGEDGSESPQAALVCGKSGSGKSCFVIDFLTQTSPGYSFTAILDNGLSYQTYARTIDPDCETVIIKPDGRVTLNYLDTRGSPLSAEHLVDVVAVAHLMAGRRNDEDGDRMRRAVISRCANDFYREFALDWLRSGDGKRPLEVGRYAAALKRRDTVGEKLSLLEKHSRFIEWASGNEAEVEKLIAEIPELEVRGTPMSAILPLSFAFMAPEEAATHTDFQQWLQLESMGDGPDRDEVGALATLLKAWCADGGIYGGIFDGVNNVHFNGKVIHLELGQIPDSAQDLRNLAALIVTNQIKHELFRRPRNQRKRVVIEEFGSFLSIPGGEQIVRELSQTSRKYGTFVCVVAQQVQGLEACLSSLLGNIRMAFLMKQSSVQEVETLTKIFDLPESASEALSRFPEPSREHGAPFLCWRSHGERPEIVTGFHVASREMLFVSSSNGSHFERRQAALAGHEDVLEGILTEAAH